MLFLCSFGVTVQKISKFLYFLSQILNPSTPQSFIVDKIIPSDENSLIALSGRHGIAVMELPRRWGKDGQFNGGKKEMTCR